MTTAAVILAAGGSTRFAGAVPKVRASLHGRPLLSRAVDHARAAPFDEVVVVAGGHAIDDLVPAGVAVLANDRWRDGIATSLHVAIAHAQEAGHEAVVVGLADQPFVATVAWEAVGSCDATPLAVATYGGERGHPVRLHRDVWELLPVTGDVGARALMRARPDLVTEVPCPGDPADVDTVDDLDRWNGQPPS